LGFGEAGVFQPESRVREWVPKKERALGYGIFNAGNEFCAAFRPMLVPWIAMHLVAAMLFFVTARSRLLAGTLDDVVSKTGRDRVARPPKSDYIKSEPVGLRTRGIPWGDC